MFSNNAHYQADLQKVISADIDWQKFHNKSFLVIGASGMLGTFLIDCLMKQNIDHHSNITIYAMGRNHQKLAERYSEYNEHANFHIHAGDVTETITLDVPVDYIIHGASNTHPKAYSRDPIGTIMTNIKGTQQVLDFAKEIPGTKILFLSTVEVYGENRGDVASFDEEYCGYIDCNTLRAGYPEGKRASEALCQAYIQQYKLDIVIPRLSRIFGPTMLKDDSKASSQFILNALNNEDIVLKSAGNQYFSYCYVADAVYGLLFLLQKGQSGEAYNIANPALDLTLKDLANKLADLAGTKVRFDLPEQSEALGYSKATTAILNIEKMQRLGWQPIYSLNESLNQVLQIMKIEE
jgi:nucleoside-diphosphate-sugar epimerase